MEWIFQYQLFLFDLDGLLVNTEELHYRAYKVMLERRGYYLPWDFMTYFRIAQKDADAPKRYIYAEFPDLLKQEPNWDRLYAEKKKIYLELLERTSAPLMPGAEKLLTKLAKADIKRAVVTHSALPLVTMLRAKNPLLDTVANWFTREDYEAPKPAPDGYFKAIERLAHPTDRIIGFEDSSRGMRALLQTEAKAIFVNAIDDEAFKLFKDEGHPTFKTLDDISL
jgi:beta-phosphoglucomutase